MDQAGGREDIYVWNEDLKFPDLLDPPDETTAMQKITNQIEQGTKLKDFSQGLFQNGRQMHLWQQQEPPLTPNHAETVCTALLAEAICFQIHEQRDIISAQQLALLHADPPVLPMKSSIISTISNLPIHTVYPPACLPSLSIRIEVTRHLFLSPSIIPSRYGFLCRRFWSQRPRLRMLYVSRFRGIFVLVSNRHTVLL